MELLEINKKIYQRFIEIINTQKFEQLPEVTDKDKYREICVGFTSGKVNLVDATKSMLKVLKGIPNLKATIEDCIAENNKVYARLKVTGTQKGNLFGMPATNNKFEIQMFDYVTIENGKIIDRVQQSDSLGQFISLFKGSFTKIGIGILLIIVALTTSVILNSRNYC